MGVLSPGDKLPSVRSLAVELGINPNTVQKAYAILENDGVIVSISGKGSFISDDNSATDAILSAAREEFRKSAAEAKRMGLKKEDLIRILNSLYEGGNSDD